METKVENVTQPLEAKHSTKKKRTRFFETYISKVLKQTSKTNGITFNAKQQLNSALCSISKTVSYVATKLTQISKKKTLSGKEVQNAVRTLFPEEICKNCLIEGSKSIKLFTANDVKNASRQEKANIIFPPSVAEKFLRNFGLIKTKVTKNAPIYLAAVLEYLTQDILSLSSSIATENKRIRITIRDLELAVRNDPELDRVFNRCNISFIGGGVLPHIHESLLVKKNKKKKTTRKAVTDTGKKTHRFRPGTVALREIRKYQKVSNCLIFAKHPFERFVRSISGKKTSKNVFVVLQYYIEQYITEVLKESGEAAIHAGRVKLMPQDIQFVCKLKNYTLHDLVTDEGDNDENKNGKVEDEEGDEADEEDEIEDEADEEDEENDGEGDEVEDDEVEDGLEEDEEDELNEDELEDD